MKNGSSVFSTTLPERSLGTYFEGVDSFTGVSHECLRNLIHIAVSGIAVSPTGKIHPDGPDTQTFQSVQDSGLFALTKKK